MKRRKFSRLTTVIFLACVLFFSYFPKSAKAALTRITITPSVTCLKIGETVTFTATAYDENGSVIAATFRWMQVGPGRGSPSANKMQYTFVATTPGRVTLSASADGVSQSVVFEVGNTQARNVQIRVDPNVAGELATYYVMFNTDNCGQLVSGDQVYLAFPYGTEFSRYSSCNAITINGIPASYYIEQDNNDNQIVVITVPKSFGDTTQVYIRMCKVQNPRGGACYRMGVATSKQPYWALSNSYAIVGSIISNPTVEVSPDIVGENAEYKIKFTTSTTGRLGSCYGGYIMVEFPYGTKIPTSISAEHILVNGQYCDDADPVVNGRVVKIYPGMVVLEESDVEVKFLLEAGIVNPSSPEQYRCVVWTNADNIRVNSSYYRIKNSLIKNVNVQIDKPYINTTSEWKINFSTGLVGTMRENGVITVYFPTSVTLPETSLPGDIRVNGIRTTKSARIEGSGTLKIFTPVGFKSESPVEIIISEEFGLQNPASVGRYIIKVHTGKEGTNVESNEFEIGPSMIGDLSISVGSPYVTVASSMEFSFKTGGGGRLTKETGQIYIIMPRGMYIPNSFVKEKVLVNGVPMATQPFVKKVENKIVLNVPVEIQAESFVEVTFMEDSGIRNPSIPGEYVFRVATSREVSYITSRKIPILESTVSDVIVDVTNTTVKDNTALHLTFLTGPAGALDAGNKIYIFIDTRFGFPEDYQSGIVLNGKNLDLFPVTISPETGRIEIKIDQDIAANERVFLQILPEAGFMNPSQSGEYTIGVSTQNESQTASSNKFTIIPLPETEIEINPTFPNGDNEWYVSEPTISFIVYSDQPDTVKSWFSINGEEWINYSQAFTLSSGEYEIRYFSQQGEAKEQIKSTIIKVDTLVPFIQMQEDTIYTNKKDFELSLTIVESNFKNAFIGDVEITSLIDGKLKLILDLEEGENKYSIIVFDQAGNRIEKQITIVLDQTPPELTIIEPNPWTKTIRKAIVISGKTEPKALVTLNGKRLPVIDGNFMTQYFCENGVNALEFIAMDIAGNTKKYMVPVTYYKDFWVKFKIGQKVAESSMGNVDLGSQIFLLESNTMIPLTIFTKFLGCKVEFESVFQILTITDPDGVVIQAQIGNRTITVNDEKKLLPVPPVIQSGRTFVPLRFFAEEFGFKINYLKEENAVKMEYYET